MVRTSDGSYGTVPDPDPVDPGGETTTSDPTDGFGDELGGDPVDSGGRNTDRDGDDDDGVDGVRDELGGDPVDSGGRNTGGGTRPDPEPTTPAGPGLDPGGGAPAPDPDPAPPTVDEIRSDIGGAVDGVTDTVSDVGAGVSDRVDAGVDRIRDVTTEPTQPPAEPPQSTAVPMGVGAGRVDRDTLRRGVTGDPADVTAPEPDPEITDDLTRGGLLSETPDSADGLLPGEVGGVDVSEERLREDAADVDRQFQDAFGSNPELTVAGSDLPDRVVTGGATAASGALNVPGLIVGAETGVEVATNAPGEIREEGAGDVAATAAGVGAALGAATVDRAQESPAEFAGGAVFNVAAGAGVGRLAGRTGRGLSDRVRTAGGTRVDPGDLASDDVVRFVDDDAPGGERFPGADDPGLFRDDPATAVAEQAERNTPQAVDDVFGSAGVDEGATLTKALDTEPEGPAPGRADQGFTAAADEADVTDPSPSNDAFAYESPGAFMSPELSPNFLRAGGGEASLSPVPGLPDLGNRPTGVLARTDVENTDADTLEGFNQELLDRAGEPTAITKSPEGDEFNVGEIEAVAPPGAEFAPVGSGGLRGAARRLGIGSDLYTEVEGRRVPLRTVAPADEVGDAADDAAGAAARADGPDAPSDAGAPLSSYVEAPGDPVDRPIPVGAGGGASPFGTSPEADPDASSPGVSGSDPGSTAPPSGGSGGPSGSGGSGGSGGPFGGGGSPPPSGGGGSEPSTGAPSGTSEPTGPAPSSPFGPVDVGASTSPAESAQPAESVADPLVPLPTPAPSQPRRRRRDDGSDEGDEADPVPFGRTERAPETDPFRNPIAGFGGLFGR